MRLASRTAGLTLLGFAQFLIFIAVLRFAPTKSRGGPYPRRRRLLAADDTASMQNQLGRPR